MTLQEVMTNGLKALQRAGIEEAHNDNQRLFEAVFGIDAAHFILYRGEEAPSDKRRIFRELIERRSKHEPLQYILGTTGFMKWDFMVNENVLIPRFDTEVLVEEFVKDVHRGAKPGQELRILDMCTGSGCIGISAGKFLQEMGYGVSLTLADISVEALMVARKNAENIGISASFIISDLFKDLPGKYNAILCNPPYIPTEDCKTLMPEVAWHEPRLALDGGADGLDLYRRIAVEAREHLLPGPGLYLEIGYDQAKAVATLLHEAGFSKIGVVKDLAGLDRVVKARV